MKYLLLFSLSILVYIYFVYPIAIYIISLFYKKKGKSKSIDSSNVKYSYCLVVPAYNEESIIEDKIRSILSIEYDPELMSIILVSDGSSDNTVSIMKKYENDKRVLVLDENDRKGKTNIINKSMLKNKRDITLFSDANVMLDKNIINELNQCFNEEDIGTVCGQLSYIDAETGVAKSGGLYWQYEEFIKESESNTGSLMGADGSIFAIRTNLYRELPLYVLDDFSTSMGTIFQGFRLVFSKRVKAYERVPEVASEEFSRKVRIANRSINTTLFLKNELVRMNVFNLFKFISHKVLRWFSGLFMILVLFSSLTLISTELGRGILVLQLLFYSCAVIGKFFSGSKSSFIGVKIVNICYFFVMVNIGTLLGVMKALLGTKVSTWAIAGSTRKS